MFGHDWQPAQATVIATRRLGNWSHGVGAYGGDITPCEYVVDVRPSGEAVFRATFHEPLMHGRYHHAQAGEVINVLFNPKSHEVKLSPEYKVSRRQHEREQDAAFRAIAEASPGTGSTQPDHGAVARGETVCIPGAGIRTIRHP